MRKINVAQICTITAILKEEIDSYVYKEFKKRFFGLNNQPEGWYFVYHFGEEYIGEKLEKENIFVENYKAYYYPHLIIRMSNDDRIDKWFKSKEELEAYLNSNEIKANKWIE